MAELSQWNRPKNNSASAAKGSSHTDCKRRPFTQGLLAALVVVVGGVLALYFICGRPKTPTPTASDPTEKKSGKIAEVEPEKPAKPTAAPKSTPTKPASTNSPKWEAAVGLDPALFPYKDGRKVLSTFTNNWDQIVDICIMPNGRSRKVIRNAKPPVFQHATDQLISVALSGSNDEELPPLPLGDGMEADFFESLKTPIVIKPDDSDAIKQAKENVIEARKIIDEELRKGRSFKEVLEEHLAQRKQNSEMRETAMQAVRDLQQNGDAALVNEYVEKVNALLDEHGVGAIPHPDDAPRKRR